MRILYILNTERPGGGNKSLFSLIKYLKEQEHTIYALVPGRNEITEAELRELNIEYDIYSYRPCVLAEGYKGMPVVRNIIAFPQMLKKVKEWDVDIIHTNSSTHDIGFWISRVLHIKHVWHVREALDLHYNSRYIYKRIYDKERNASEATICVSRFIYEREKKYGKNTYMIYNPYIVDSYLDEKHEILRDKMISILVAGYITKSKGQLEALQGIEKVVNEFHIPVHLTIIGNYNDIVDIQEIQTYISTNNLENSITVLPFTNDLREIRAKTDIVLNCSKYEAFPRVVIEGMLAGCLVISNDSGGSGEILEDGKKGLLYHMGDIDDLAKKIIYVHQHLEECRDMAAYSRTWAKSSLDYKISGEKVVKIYEGVLK